MDDDVNARVETDWYDEQTVTVSVSFDETEDTDPSKLRFLLPDGTELAVEKSESTEQMDGKAVYEVIGVKKAK